MNYLMLSVGRRGELMKNFRSSMEIGSKIIAGDNSPYAPALYFADKQYLLPRIDAPEYIDIVLDICIKERINAVMTFIDPEIMLLSENRKRFEKNGVEVLAPYEETARICFDKWRFAQYCTEHGILTARTYGTVIEVEKALENGDVNLPLFVKPRCGSGSIGARKINYIEELEEAFRIDETLIAQEYMTGNDAIDLDADIYIDTISHEPVAIFCKKKLSTVIGGANKTISFKDEKLFDFVKRSLQHFRFNGPIDADFFYKDGEYYLSEINPRFGGAYLHAYGAGVDFIKLIENNLHGKRNKSDIGNYEEGVVMMMFDSVVIRRKKNGRELLEQIK